MRTSIFLLLGFFMIRDGLGLYMFVFEAKPLQLLAIDPGSYLFFLGPGHFRVRERPRFTTLLGLGPGSFMIRDWPRPTYILL